MKKITLLLFAISFSITAFAQITVKGSVLSDSIPMESASIVIKNSTKGVATNAKGRFKIEAKKGDTLSVSYLGYKTQEYLVLKDETLKINLEVDNALEEVLVVGYMSTTKTYCKTICRTSCGIYCKGVLIEEVDTNENPAKLYPNPSSTGIFQLRLNEDYDEVKISIANMSGRIIQNKIYQKNNRHLNVDLSQFSTGIYIVNVIEDGKRLKAVKAIRQ